MRKLTLAVAVVFACGLLSGPALLQQQRGGEDETGPYEVVPNPQQVSGLVDRRRIRQHGT